MILNQKDRLNIIYCQYVDDIKRGMREEFFDDEQEKRISLLEKEIIEVIGKYKNPRFQRIISQAIGESALKANQVYEKSRERYDSSLNIRNIDDGNRGFELDEKLDDLGDEYILERACETARSINENLENLSYVKIRNKDLFLKLVSKTAVYAPQKCKKIVNAGFMLESEEKLGEVVKKLSEIETPLKYTEIRNICVSTLSESFNSKGIDFGDNYDLFRSIIEGDNHPINHKFVREICRTFNGEEKTLALRLAGDVSRLYDDETSGFVCSTICSYIGPEVKMLINRIREISDTGKLRSVFGLDKD